MPLAVVTDCDHGNIGPEEAILGAVGIEVCLGQVRTGEEVISLARQADGLIVQYAPITARVRAAGLEISRRLGYSGPSGP